MTDLLVFLKCPICGHQWHAGTIRPNEWWAKSCSPETLAKQCYCPACDGPPPMTIIGEDVQPRLFE